MILEDNPPDSNNQLAAIKLGGVGDEVYLAIQSHNEVTSCRMVPEGMEKKCKHDSRFIRNSEELPLSHTAIATAGDGWFYGFSNGELMEFKNQIAFDSDFMYSTTVY